MFNKRLFYTCILMCFSFLLFGCSKEKKAEQIESDLSKVYQDSRELISNVNNSDFILATPDGKMALYNISGELLDELVLDSSSKSSYIYCEDSGEIFSKNLLNIDSFNSIFYAVDVSNGSLFVIKNYDNKLKVIKTKSLKESKDIIEIKAYNGMFYYLAKGNGKSSNKFTIAKSEEQKMTGVINYSVQIPIERRGKIYSYIYLENLFDTYIEGMELKDKLKSSDISNINLADIKRSCFRIPYDIDSWTITNNLLFYYAKDTYGTYDMEKDILSANYGTSETISASYVPGRNSAIYSLNQMGENSLKTLLIKKDSEDASVEKVVEYDGSIPLGYYIDTTLNVLYIIYKEDNLATYGKLKIIDLSNYKELNTISFDFVPTHIKGHNGYYYVMNEFEDFFIIGSNSTKEYTSYPKYFGESNTSNILICNTIKKDNFLYDANGRYINEEGKLLDYKGNLINEKQQKVNKYGQILDDYGRAINAKGELVDKYGNIIDENGKIIQYVIQKDGYCRSSNGTIVDETGKTMIRKDDGTYIKDEEEIPDIEWHYDEKGEIVIDADYLEKYPDAKSWIKEDGTYDKGESVISGNETTETIEATEKSETSNKTEKSEKSSFLDKLTFWN